MERKGTLLSVRSDVRVLDATIRDGGLVNDFFSRMNLFGISIKPTSRPV